MNTYIVEVVSGQEIPVEGKSLDVSRDEELRSKLEHERSQRVERDQQQFQIRPEQTSQEELVRQIDDLRLVVHFSVSSRDGDHSMRIDSEELRRSRQVQSIRISEKLSS